MELEQQLVNLELSKKLKELGVKQESLWYWDECYSMKRGNCYDLFRKDDISEDGELPLGAISAFTVAELGEMLPVTIQMNDQIHWFECTKTKHAHRCGYIYESTDGTTGWGRLNDTVSHSVGVGKTEANARAKMLIYLIENKLI